MLSIKTLGSNPQKFVNSFLFDSFSLRVFKFFYFEITFKFFLIFRFNRMLQRYFFTKILRHHDAESEPDWFNVVT